MIEINKTRLNALCAYVFWRSSASPHPAEGLQEEYPKPTRYKGEQKFEQTDGRTVKADEEPSCDLAHCSATLKKFFTQF